MDNISAHLQVHKNQKANRALNSHYYEWCPGTKPSARLNKVEKCGDVEKDCLDSWQQTDTPGVGLQCMEGAWGCTDNIWRKPDRYCRSADPNRDIPARGYTSGICVGNIDPNTLKAKP